MPQYGVVLAKALYDNDSEADDELSFKKGDVITVLETDFEGMTGWWLCTLGDKQGVAPGNRLQLLSYGTDDVIDDMDDLYDIPGKAHKQKFGNVDYDVPKAHTSTAEYQDYAIPKTRFGNIPTTTESQRHGFVLPSPRTPKAFDVRNSDSSDGLVTNEVYDAPSNWSSERSSAEFRFSGEGYQEIGTEEMYDVPSRNSLESDDGGGTQDYAIPTAPILPPKATTMDAIPNNQDIYDSPAGIGQEMSDVKAGYSQGDSDVYDKPPLPGNDGEKLTGLLQSLSVDGGTSNTIPEEVYDTPPIAPEDIYDVPPTGELSQPVYDTVNVVADSNNNPPSMEHGSTGTSSDPPVDAIYDELPENVKVVPGGMYDNFDFDDVLKELDVEQPEEVSKEIVQERNNLGRAEKITKFGKSPSNESDDYVDYQEIYGMGKDEPPKADEKRASVQHSAFDRIHMDKVRELRITHSVAMTNLDKLQQAVDVAVTKLLSFVTEDWRQPEVLALNLNGIRDLSGKVKVALRLLTEFGLGALLNSQNLPDNGTSRKIREALEPLLQTYYSIKSAIQHLDETNWRSAYQMTDDDELNSIARMAQGIPCDAYKLGAVIANVSTFLFSKSSGEPATQRKSSPVNVQKESVRGLEAKKVDSEQVSIHGRQRLVPQPFTKTPAAPATLPKPKREKEVKKNVSDGKEAIPGNVSELTNNLLNEIEDMKQPKPTFRRQGSKRLSPKTVRRLCSIGLKDERSSDKIFEDVTSTPPKPSRRCSSPASSPAPDQPTFSTRLSTSMSDPALDTNLQNDKTSVHRLSSFVEKMDSQFVCLKEGIKNFVESVRRYEKPNVFVAHSKFIVLSAHKLVYVGDGASRSQTNAMMKNTIATVTNSLSDVINEFVEGIKLAARQYPDEAAMNAMIRSAANVTEKALELYKTLRNHEGS